MSPKDLEAWFGKMRVLDWSRFELNHSLLFSQQEIWPLFTFNDQAAKVD